MEGNYASPSGTDRPIDKGYSPEELIYSRGGPDTHLALVSLASNYPQVARRRAASGTGQPGDNRNLQFAYHYSGL
jgi:hypothetical protein